MADFKICPLCNSPVTCIRKTIGGYEHVYLESQFPRWIRADEGLPADWKYVLVIDHYDEDAWEPSIAFWDGEKWTIANETVVARVTHWMPLPEPPKELEEKYEG